MRTFVVKKNRSVIFVAAMLIVFSLIASPLVQACGCICLSGKTMTKGVAVTITAAEALCCYSNVRCCPTDSPLCCCTSNTEHKPFVEVAILSEDDPRPSFKEFKLLEAVSSGSTLHHNAINGRSSVSFFPNSLSISPHISSTILLL